MPISLDLAVGGATILANLLGSGLLYKVISSSFREAMREIFLTKESATEIFVKKEDAAAAYATKDSVKEQWASITDHVIQPLMRITERLDELFNSQGKIATDVGILMDRAKEQSKSDS